jgi:molecular chaperone IbpA
MLRVWHLFLHFGENQMNNALTKWERYAPVGIGLEDMFRRLDAFSDSTSQNYPPYNIVKLDEDKHQLQIALAGWDRDQIEVTVEQRILQVKTVDNHEVVGEYIHKGVSSRTFARNWQLSEDTIVEDVRYINGMLLITLVKEIPEEHKRRVLPIS